MNTLRSLTLLLVLFVGVSYATKCLYLHDVGQSSESKKIDRNPSYGFGGVPSSISACENYFYTTRTIERGWDNAELQGEYCKAIQTAKPDIVFTHGMGSLIVAAGIANDLAGCSDVKKTVSWYGIGGPFQGTPAADAIAKMCDSIRKGAKPNLIKNIKECGKAVDSLRTNYKSAGLYQTNGCAGVKCLMHYSEKYMKGNLCGFNPNGDTMLSGFKTTLEGLALPADISVKWDIKTDGKLEIPKNGNDGCVGASSCRNPSSKYTNDPSAALFAFNGNHVDASCNADGTSSCQWMNSMIKTSASQKSAKFKSKMHKHNKKNKNKNKRNHH